MGQRTLTPLPIGAGIDRATGEAATQPGAFRDLRNVILKEGKAQVRKGLASKVSVTMNGSANPATDLIHLGPFRAANRGLLVAFELGASAAQAVEVWRTATTGLNPVFGYAWTMPSAPNNLAQVFGVESYAKYFLAHDEPSIAIRAPTVYLSTGFTGTVLQADLDGGGAADVLFRGVGRYLDYAMGWGFGTDSDKDRPEILRMSYPGDPTTWDPNHYFVCGPRTEPILYAAGMPSRVLVLKETELYAIDGYDRVTFSVRLVDPLYGLAGSHLATVVGDECFFWSKSGPRVSSGGPSEDLGLPLDLEGPSPEDLVAAGDAAYGWSTYIHDQRIILFGFPDRGAGKTRVYCLSVRNPNQPRWSYLEVQKALMSVGTFFAATGGAPAGYPDIGTLSATADELTVPWTNITAVGDEIVEIWLKVGAGSYMRVRNSDVATGAGATAILTAADGVTPGQTHTVALRYRRGVEYTANYGDPVTSAWGATELSQSVDSIAVPAVPSAPGSVVESNCAENVYGGKTYVEKTVSWSNAVTGGVGHVTELWIGVSGSGFAPVFPYGYYLAASVPVVGGTDQVVVTFLKSPGGSTSDHHVVVRHKLVTGETSAEVVVDTSPWVPADGCTP